MSAANATYAGAHGASRSPVAQGIRNGLIASLAMAMIMMVLGAFDTGFFAAPSSIWAFFAGPDAYAPHTLSLSFVLGFVFAFVASRVLRISGVPAAVVAGTVYALVVMALMFVVVLPAFPNGAIVIDSAALWIWIAGHVAYGMVAGLLYSIWR